jgi:carbon-monoxide dehydrogenase medium subunit
MHAFNYHRPSTLKEAAALAARDNARVLAGGQTLVQAMKTRLASPGDLVDLAALPALTGITVDGPSVVIGAMTRHADVAESSEVRRAIPALATLAGTIGDRQVRHLGTLGGSIANNDPAADYPAALLALGATIVTTAREHAADAFFRGLYETALEPGEIIKSVRFPVPRRAGYAKFMNAASRFAIVGVFVAHSERGVRVAVTGAADCVFRVPQMEQALTARFEPDAVANVRVEMKNLNSDLHADADYRAHLVTVMAKRAVEAAL